MDLKNILILSGVAVGVFLLLKRRPGLYTTDGKELFLSNGGDGFLYDQNGGRWL